MVAPRVSVVIPTYQRRDLVRRAAASALAQTVRDIEVIVVDDGSTDGTQGALAGSDPRLRVIWQENAGLSAARNTGLRAARGEIVGFLDSDDRWLPDHLAVVTEVLERHPEAVLCSTAPRFDVGGSLEPRATEVVDALPLLYAENIVGHPSAVAVRREPILALGGFDARLRLREAWEMWLRLAQRGPFGLLRRRTIIHQMTDGSLSQRGGGLAYLDILVESAAAVAAASDRPDAPELRARALGREAYFEALYALDRGDAGTVQTALAEACARLPELSTEAQLVANRLSLVEFGPEGRLRSFSAAARLWPDPSADTAVYLRRHALALAVRLGRGSEAARLLRDWPLGATSQFVVRRLDLLAALGRRSAQKLAYRGQEPVQASHLP